MNLIKTILLMLGMTVVTFIPKAIPALMMEKIHLSERAERFLKLIPYTAMSALIFPGVFSVDAGHPAIGIAGGAAAAVLAWKKKPVMACVLAAVGIDFVLYLLIA